MAVCASGGVGLVQLGFLGNVEQILKLKPVVCMANGLTMHFLYMCLKKFPMQWGWLVDHGQGVGS